MELTKAIELLHDLHKIPDTQLDPDYLDAVALGIEALIAWRQHQRKKAPANLYLLPGETPSDAPSSPSTLINLGY